MKLFLIFFVLFAFCGCTYAQVNLPDSLFENSDLVLVARADSAAGATYIAVSPAKFYSKTKIGINDAPWSDTWNAERGNFEWTQAAKYLPAHTSRFRVYCNLKDTLLKKGLMYVFFLKKINEKMYALPGKNFAITYKNEYEYSLFKLAKELKYYTVQFNAVTGLDKNKKLITYKESLRDPIHRINLLQVKTVGVLTQEVSFYMRWCCAPDINPLSIEKIYCDSLGKEEIKSIRTFFGIQYPCNDSRYSICVKTDSLKVNKNKPGSYYCISSHISETVPAQYKKSAGSLVNEKLVSDFISEDDKKFSLLYYLKKNMLELGK